ncbi:MAG: pseudouridine synthase [bacterium]|nr:pseudouridine synthase [bacterium]
MLNKPKGSITTTFDPQGRLTIMEILKRRDLFHVGRLDKDTRGLLIVTNDGDLANRLLHPRYEIERKYRVTIKGKIDDNKIERLLKGIELEDGMARFDSVRVLEVSKERSVLEVSLHEGRKRMIRRMFDKIENPVLDLLRIQFGPIKLGNLKEGEVRTLTKEEIERLKCL